MRDVRNRRSRTRLGGAGSAALRAVDQVIFVKTTKPLTGEEGGVAELFCIHEPGHPSVIANLQGQ